MAIVKGTTGIGVASDQTLGYLGTTAIIVREVGSEVFHLDPSAAPFTLLTDKAGSAGTDNPRFEWYEKALRPKATQVNAGGGYTDGAVTMTVDDATVFRVGDVVLVPRSDDKLRVSSVDSATQITVTRGVAGATAAALVDNDDLFVIGSAWAEGADVSIPDEWQETHKWNLCQIFRSPFGASRTRTKTKTYLGDTKAKLGADAGIMHAIDMERAYLFSGREEEGSGPDTLTRYTGGFTYFATSNILDLAGVTLSEPDLEGWLEDVFAHTAASDARTLFASPALVSAFDLLPMDKVQLAPSDKTYGLAINQYKTSHGVLNIVKHRLLVNGDGGEGWGDWGLCVDVSRLKDRVLESTKLLVNRQGNGRDGWISEYLTESGLELRNPEVHGIIKNVGAFV